MTDPSESTQIVVALITQLPAILTAIAAVAGAGIAYWNVRKTDANTKVTVATKDTADRLVVKADEIHESTNGTLDKLKHEVAAGKEESARAKDEAAQANREIKRLRAQIAKLIRQRDQTAAPRPVRTR